MAPTGNLRKTVRQEGAETNYNSPLIQNKNEKIQFGPDPNCHHRHMLANMSCLVEAENLTDMTIQCSEGYYIHTHRKLLSSVSSLARKLSREHGGLGENQRLHLIINDTSRQTVLHFLKILYTGYTEGLQVSDFDEVHKLCQLLGVAFNDNSVSLFAPSRIPLEKKYTELPKGPVLDESNTIIMSTLAMGFGNPNPSDALVVANCQIITDTSKISKLDAKRDSRMENKKEARHETGVPKGKKSLAKESVNKLPVYCICREEERPGMIGCDYCDEWYHTQCLSLNKEEVKRLANENWSCPNCEFKRVKSRKQPSHGTSKHPPKIANQQLKSSEIVSETLHAKDVLSNCEKTNSDQKNSLKITSPTAKRNIVQLPNVATPQRTKRKRRGQPNEEALNFEENVNMKARGDDVHKNKNSEAKKICGSIVETKNPKEPTQNNIVADSHANVEPLQNKGDIESRSQPQDDDQGILAYEETKCSKVNGLGSSSSNQYQSKNKRMTVPVQKKQKRSFEEALFGGSPAFLHNKRDATAGEKSNIKTVAKSPNPKDGITTFDGLPSSNENQKQVNEGIHSVGAQNLSDSVSKRTISVQSRAADDENSSPSEDTKKAKKMKKRSKFPKDRNKESTTSTQDSSEEHGPLSPPSPTFLPISLDKHTPPNIGTSRDLQDKSRKRSISSSSNHSHSQKETKEDEDSTNQLFFCYKCKSIFVSKTSLDAHKKAADHYE